MPETMQIRAALVKEPDSVQQDCETRVFSGTYDAYAYSVAEQFPGSYTDLHSSWSGDADGTLNHFTVNAKVMRDDEGNLTAVFAFGNPAQGPSSGRPAEVHAEIARDGSFHANVDAGFKLSERQGWQAEVGGRFVDGALSFTVQTYWRADDGLRYRGARTELA